MQSHWNFGNLCFPTGKSSVHILCCFSQSTEQKWRCHVKLSRVLSMHCVVSPDCLAAEYRTELKMPRKIGESSIHALCCFSWVFRRRVCNRIEHPRKKQLEFDPCPLNEIVGIRAFLHRSEKWLSSNTQLNMPGKTARIRSMHTHGSRGALSYIDLRNNYHQVSQSKWQPVGVEWFVHACYWNVLRSGRRAHSSFETVQEWKDCIYLCIAETPARLNDSECSKAESNNSSQNCHVCTFSGTGVKGFSGMGEAIPGGATVGTIACAETINLKRIRSCMVLPPCESHFQPSYDCVKRVPQPPVPQKRIVTQESLSYDCVKHVLQPASPQKES